MKNYLVQIPEVHIRFIKVAAANERQALDIAVNYFMNQYPTNTYDSGQLMSGYYQTMSDGEPEIFNWIVEEIK